MSGDSKTSFDSIFRRDLFAGQVVLVTGGGTGIGRCTAHELASLGATVVIAARRKEKLEETQAEITDLMYAAEKFQGRTRTRGHFGFAGHNDPVRFRRVRARDR